MLTNACKALAKQGSSHVLLTYILDSPLGESLTHDLDYSLGYPLIVTMLPSFTVNLYCCASGHCAPFLHC